MWTNRLQILCAEVYLLLVLIFSQLTDRRPGRDIAWIASSSNSQRRWIDFPQLHSESTVPVLWLLDPPFQPGGTLHATTTTTTTTTAAAAAPVSTTNTVSHWIDCVLAEAEPFNGFGLCWWHSDSGGGRERMPRDDYQARETKCTSRTEYKPGKNKAHGNHPVLITTANSRCTREHRICREIHELWYFMIHHSQTHSADSSFMRFLARCSQLLSMLR